MITRKEAFDRIINAYTNNEIDPFMNCACFVGNLLGTSEWAYHRTIMSNGMGKLNSEDDVVVNWLRSGPFAENPQIAFSRAKQVISDAGFTRDEILRLESTFLSSLNWKCVLLTDRPASHIYPFRLSCPQWEEALFYAINTTLTTLDKMYVGRGEEPNPTPTCQKRDIKKLQLA